MKNVNAACLFQNDMTTVKVVFDFSNIISSNNDFLNISAKKYTYKITKNSGIKAGDVIAVPANGEVKIVLVVEVDDEPDIDYDARYKYQWVIQKIDTSEYHKRVDSENKFYKTLRSAEKKKIQKELVEEILSGTYGIENAIKDLAIVDDSVTGGENENVK